MYKLCLVQNRWSKYWNWYLQTTEPFDVPFDKEKAEFSGIHIDLRGAMRMAHELVPKDKVDYIYMDRRVIYG